MGALVAFGVSFLLGALFLKRVLGANTPLRPLSQALLAPILGLSLSSLALFWGLVFFEGYSAGVFYWVWAMHIVAIGGLLWLDRKSKHPLRVSFHWHRTSLPYISVGLIVVGLIVFGLLQSPYGTGLDVWALWRLKARFLLYSDSLWTSLADFRIGFSCRDYPLFYPLTMVWGWVHAGGERSVVGFAIMIIFCLSAALCLMDYFSKENARRKILAGLFLVSAPAWVGLGASQYCDILLSCAYLMAFVTLWRAFTQMDSRLIFLSGLLLGFCVWIKNEGWLLVGMTVVCGGGHQLLLSPDKKWKPGQIILFLLGFLIFLIPTIVFKSVLGLSNEKMNMEQIQLAIWENRWVTRWPLMWPIALEEIIKENSWVYHWVFIFGVIGYRIESLWKNRNIWAVFALCLIQIGYWTVYVISPIQVEINMKTSIDRLLAHTFPVWAFVAFTAFWKTEESA